MGHGGLERACRTGVSDVWASEADFLAWTRSDSFRAAHAQAGRKPADAKPLYIGGPSFEGYAAIQIVDGEGAASVDRQRGGLTAGVRHAPKCSRSWRPSRYCALYARRAIST